MKNTWTEIINGKEAKCVSNQWHNVEARILDEKVRKLTGGKIYACEMNVCACMLDEPIQMGVNWAAIGTVSPTEAAMFAEKLSDAAMLAAEYKYNGYVERFIPWDEFSEEEQTEIKAYMKERLREAG